jgi:oligopeptide/dipeptide ABC transporter ATP-binding protein
MDMNTASPHLSLRGVSKAYPIRSKSLLGQARGLIAVNDVSLDVAEGETLGLVGESGCGKSSLARLIMHLEQPTAGSIVVGGTDMTTLSAAALKQARRQFQMIFQDPYASLNPRMTARDIIAEPLRNYHEGSRESIDARVVALAESAGLTTYHLDKYPHELSGGQCQRVGIARAIALRPALIVADEPVSALDVSIQAQILNLLMRLQQDMRLTMIFVSHDLSVVAHIADRVAVMYLGRIIELAPAAALFATPAHPYTQTLLAAVPRPAPGARGRRRVISGELPSPLNPPSGCHFRPRCPMAQALCAEKAPPLVPLTPGHTVACHFAEQARAHPVTEGVQ